MNIYSNLIMAKQMGATLLMEL